MQIALFIPEPAESLSSAVVYDRRMLEGLRAAGSDADAIEVAGRHPLPDACAEAAARQAWQTLPARVVPVIDGFCLPAFEPLLGELVRRGAAGLIHHPTALKHGMPEDARERLREIERRMFAALPRLIVASELVAARLAQEFAVDPARITIVEPGVDDAPRSPGSGGPGCTIFSIGALVPRKGHDLLLRALARLFDLHWRLTIVGDATRNPAHAAELTALAEELGIAGRVAFAGEVADTELERLWQKADVFALATRWEGYGAAVAQALKRGLPVAVAAGGAAGALVSPEAGVVCPVDDVEQFSKALRRLIFDVPLRREMAEAAWQLGQRLPDWRTQAKVFAAALDSR